MSLQNLTRFPRLEFIGAPTPLEYLPRFSDYVGRDIFIKRDDVTPMAMGATSCVSWSFWPRMHCVKGGHAHHRRGNPVQPRSSDGGSRGEAWSPLRGTAGKPDWHAGRKLSHQR
jgi:hypothetical protein